MPVGDGHKIQYWQDNCIPDIGPLLRYIPTDVNLNLDCRLHEMIAEDGLWNLDLFHVWLSKEVTQAIKGIPHSHPFKGPNRISWSHTSSGIFSLKSAYKAINGGAWNPDDEK